MTKAELAAVADAHGVDISGARTTAEIEAALQAAGVQVVDVTRLEDETHHYLVSAPGTLGVEFTGGPATATVDSVRVRFLERNTHPERGTFEPGEETFVNATRARIWREGGVVEIVGEE